VNVELLGLELRTAEDSARAAQQVRLAARLLELDPQQAGRLGTAASELCRLGVGAARLTLSGTALAPGLTLRLDLTWLAPGLRPARLPVAVARLMEQAQEHPDGITAQKVLPDWARSVETLHDVAAALLSQQPGPELQDVRDQNEQLTTALLAVRDRHAQLRRLNSELEQTNRGVVALYDELEQRAETLRVSQTDLRAAYEVADAARQSAERSAARLQLLSDVSELLSSHDPGAAVGELARAVVPALADWCTVTVSDDVGGVQTLGWAHRDRDGELLLTEYARHQGSVITEGSAVAACLRTGSEVDVRQVPVADWVQPQARAALEQLRPGSVLVVPLRAGGRTLGAMALVAHPERGPLDEPDRVTARELARRAGLALDNARLYEQQRSLAEVLQQSLLTSPPVPFPVQVAVRYQAAAAQAQVGGDWYDAFTQMDGSPVVVIGDVIGHDEQAAAAMGQVRSLLRGIAYSTTSAPGAVLRRLDEALLGLVLGTSASVVVARVEPVAGEHLLRWSNAGHPPPLLATGDGRVRALAGSDSDLMLGIDPHTVRQEGAVPLQRGDTVLLYTDGLVERRGVSLDVGIASLTATFARLAHRPLEDLCDEVLSAEAPVRGDDDIALLAFRLHA
jgi:serine phosphatase RsbU (regulator of sigma subunit)